MLKASALYIVIIIALVTGLLCSSLIVSAYYYKLQYQKKFRYDKLQNNLASGINILLSTKTEDYSSEQNLDLFGNGDDSVNLHRIAWGVYDIGISKAYIQHDTLYKVFSIANTIDSSKWAALYLIDEDRPLSVSGHTLIKGNAFIPKAGIKEAYVDGRAYQGDKRLVIGKTNNSDRTLPNLQAQYLTRLQQLKQQSPKADSLIRNRDSLVVSFLSPTKYINFKKKARTISDIKLSGNIILLSDTIITISSSATLDNVIIFAKAIKVEGGFKGKAQLFATDSIGIGSNCTFQYPSCIGVMRFQNDKKVQGKINIGDNTQITGALFTYEQQQSTLQTLIDMGNNTKVYGQVYAQGLIRFNKNGAVYGAVAANRFLYKTTYTTYENYLIDVTLDQSQLSRYYQSSSLFPVSANKQQVLQWLESN